MLNNKIGFIKYCNKKISVNNKEIFKELIYGIEQMTLVIKNKGIENNNLKKLLEAIIDVMTKTDINKQILEKYRQKIEDCYSKIDRFIESNKNKYDLIYALKECNIKLNEI